MEKHAASIRAISLSLSLSLLRVACSLVLSGPTSFLSLISPRSQRLAAVGRWIIEWSMPKDWFVNDYWAHLRIGTLNNRCITVAQGFLIILLNSVLSNVTDSIFEDEKFYSRWKIWYRSQSTLCVWNFVISFSVLIEKSDKALIST
jgi:hypothetical protein